VTSPDTHAHAAPEPREFTHPLVWLAGLLLIVAVVAYGFFHFLSVGRTHGRELPPIRVESGGPGEPDHAKLAENRGQDVLDRGQMVYSKNCASCHGANGNQNAANSNPPARNFHTEAFKNEHGGGPYGLYMVTMKGHGNMSAVGGLSPEDRYAVVHFIREVWVKNENNAHYVGDDAPAIKATIPKPGSGGGGEEKPVDPLAVTAPPALQPLMAAMAKYGQAEVAALDDWLRASARLQAEQPNLYNGELAAPIAMVQTLVRQQPAMGLGLYGANDTKTFIQRLLAPNSTSIAGAEFRLLPAETLDALAVHFLRAASAAQHPATGEGVSK
jgi:mono/diheme cytochrome c family protein